LFICLLLCTFLIYTLIHRNATPVYNESRLHQRIWYKVMCIFEILDLLFNCKYDARFLVLDVWLEDIVYKDRTVVTKMEELEGKCHHFFFNLYQLCVTSYMQSKWPCIALAYF
jgi:hypothetical protein